MRSKWEDNTWVKHIFCSFFFAVTFWLGLGIKTTWLYFLYPGENSHIAIPPQVQIHLWVLIASELKKKKKKKKKKKDNTLIPTGGQMLTSHHTSAHM